ncbi:MAG: hypothetical protein ABSA21_03545 [Candidatus Limnocylindrales bacterium]|jgi:hypothetical protein
MVAQSAELPGIPDEDQMTKRSRHEREQRAAENVRVKQITADWERAVPPERAASFALEVEAARARGPLPARPDMAPGTAPNPPRPGNEPRPPKKEETRHSRY